ncbi:MAG: hypothetical protein FWG28_08475 [Clostridiales bacterium]|nr:hypothetical protein [Clostridiales bacterium]
MGSRLYPYPLKYVLNTINDVREIQDGRGTGPPGARLGINNFEVNLYRQKWEYRFTVTEVEKNRCRVDIEVGGDVEHKEEKILREFAMLESCFKAFDAYKRITLKELKDTGA